MKIYDLIIVGGGIGGMTAAARVKNKSVLILDANDRIGKKLLSTGAGKCNFLNENFDVGKYNDESFVSATFEKYGFLKSKSFLKVWDCLCGLTKKAGVIRCRSRQTPCLTHIAARFKKRGGSQNVNTRHEIFETRRRVQGFLRR